MKIAKQLFRWMDEIYIRENRILTEKEITSAYKLLQESIAKQEGSSLLNESKDIDTILDRWKALAGLEKLDESK